MRRRQLVVGAGSALALASSVAIAKTETRTLTAADVHPATYPTVTAVAWIAEKLQQSSNGTLRIKQYHSGQLGRESDTVDLVRLSALDITRVFAGGLNNAVPETKILSLPFVFRSVPHQRACLDGEFGQRILESLQTYQLKGLAIYDAGARNFYAHKAIRGPSDLKGLKIRVPVSDMFIELLTELGANPTPLAYGAVYSALETKLIDGAENNLRSYHSSRHFETAKVLSMSAHTYTPDLLVLSLKTWNQLGSEQQRLLEDLGRQSVAVMRTSWDQGDTQARNALEAAKVQFQETDADAFSAACQPLLQRYLSQSTLRDLNQMLVRAAQ